MIRDTAAHLGTSVAVFASALACYAALAQSALYAGDGFFLLDSLRVGAYRNSSHEGFFPLMHGFAWLLPDGWSPQRTLTLLSACGSALGVAATWCGMNLLYRAQPARALAATALVATTPAVVFFATVVEYHGAFFAFAQLAFWSAARCIVRPSCARGVALGLAMTASAFVHSTGVLLVVLLPPFVASVAATRRATGDTATFPTSTATALAGALLTMAVSYPSGLWLFEVAGVRTNHGLIRQHLLVFLPDVLLRWRFLPQTLWWEWLWPFLPLSVATLLATRAPAVRRAALLVLGSVVGYAMFAALMLGDWLHERGAYLLPCAAPAAFVCAHRWPTRCLCGLAALGAILAVAKVRVHDGKTAQYAALVQRATTAAAGRRPILLASDVDERAACTVHAGAIDHLFGYHLDRIPEDGVRAGTHALRAFVEGAMAAGQQPLITQHGLSTLEHGSAGGAELVAILRREFRLRAVGEGEERVFVITP